MLLILIVIVQVINPWLILNSWHRLWPLLFLLILVITQLFIFRFLSHLIILLLWCICFWMLVILHHFISKSLILDFLICFLTYVRWIWIWLVGRHLLILLSNLFRTDFLSLNLSFIFLTCLRLRRFGIIIWWNCWLFLYLRQLCFIFFFGDNWLSVYLFHFTLIWIRARIITGLCFLRLTFAFQLVSHQCSFFIFWWVGTFPLKTTIVISHILSFL